MEVCTSIKAVKYLYKYIHKGPDRARIEVHNDADEITNYLDSRYVTASEAVWHVFRYSMHDKSHVLVRRAGEFGLNRATLKQPKSG